MKKFVGICALLLAGTANASLMELNWTTTVSGLEGSTPGIVGEVITTTFTVDNGGTSLLGQSWDETNFLSYRVEGNSGWWMESDFIDTSSSSGLFSTDALGNVITAGNWYGGFFSGGTISTSWAGLSDGGWWNNGSNQVACTTSNDCVSAVNVSENLIGASWAASEASAVPEPSGITLLGLALAGLGFARKKKRS